MPIIIRDFKWTQTLKNITVRIPYVNGVNLKTRGSPKIDVFISTRYIKANYREYFFEAILNAAVDDKQSKCTITDNEIIFELVKSEEGEWESLEPAISKSEKLELKKRILEESYEKVRKDEEEIRIKKAELKKEAVRKQIEVDTETRENIEKIKKNEQKIVLADIDTWKEVLPQKEYKELKQVLAPELPPIRTSKTIEIELTPREFPTPLRESKIEEENEWLTKQAEARRACGFISEEIRPEERNPLYLKAKGDEFMAKNNYLGAISAYSFGIKISPKFADLYLARSEAHLKLGNFNKVTQDCSSAIDLYKPECSSNLKQRALCIGRRGIALHKLGMKRQAIEELVHSLKLHHDPEFEKYLDDEIDD